MRHCEADSDRHPFITVDPIERVNNLYAESARLIASAVEHQAGAIHVAAQCIVGSLLGGGKVLSCGNGSSAADAQYFAAQMQHRFERERPGLPAIALNADAAVLTAIAIDDGFAEIYAKQVGALGQPGDVLLTMRVDASAGNMLAAQQAARERQMHVIALTGGDDGEVPARIAECDIEIRTPSVEAARILENHRLVIHCLCDLIDLQLLGG